MECNNNNEYKNSINSDNSNDIVNGSNKNSNSYSHIT